MNFNHTSETTLLNIHDIELCYFWLDENKVLHIEAKDSLFTEYNLKKNFDYVRKVIGTEMRYKILYDATNNLPIDRKIRLLLEEMCENTGTSLAVVAKSKLGHMVASIFFALSTTKIPKKMFNNHDEAMEWLLNQ